MPSIEEIVRTALQEKAVEVPPQTVPPLRLPASGRESRTIRRRGSGVQARYRWLAAPAAAALVLAVVASSVLVSRSLQDRGRLGSQTAGVLVPPYYVALIGSAAQPVSGIGPSVELKRTLTGQVLARIAVPEPYAGFSGVAASARGNAFLLTAQATARTRQPAEGLFLLRVKMEHGRPSPAPLQLVRTFAAAAEPTDLAMSPDGTKLAYLAPATAHGRRAPQYLVYVDDLVRGIQHQRNGPPPGQCGSKPLFPHSLSVTDGQLVTVIGKAGFIGIGQRSMSSVSTTGVLTWVCDGAALTLPPSDAVAADWISPTLSGDGSTMMVVRKAPGSSSTAPRQQLVTYTMVRPSLAPVVINDLPVYGAYERMVWASPSAQTMIVAGARPGASAGIISHGRYTPIPWQAGILSAAW